MSKIEVIVGENIKHARAALEWKQEELAQRTGIARSTIAKIEKGATVTAGTLSTIADALGIPPYVLMLRPIDCKRLANMATTCQSKIRDFERSGQQIDPAVVERIQEHSASSLKKERREAVSETNAIVAKIFGMTLHSDDADVQQLERARSAGVGILTQRLPCHPIVNGLVANLISA